MDLSNYTGLLATLDRHFSRDDLEEIPACIQMCEAEMNRRLRVRRMVTTSTAMISDGRSALPSDYAGWISMTLNGEELGFSTLQELDRLAYSYTAEDQPRAVAVVGDELRFLPSPNADYEAELTYYAKVPALTVSNQTNWVLTNHPDAYFYGTLKHAAPFVVEDDRVPMWNAMFEQALAGIIAASGRESRGAGKLRTDLPLQRSTSLRDALYGRV